MTVEISPSWISAGCAMCAVFGGGVVSWVNTRITPLKAAQKILFEKLDNVTLDLQGYKLHVAETYVNRAALKEALEPINESLKEIKEDLRDERGAR